MQPFFLEQFRHSWRMVYYLGQIYLVTPGAILHPGSDIHRLTETINAIIERHRYGRATVNADSIGK